MCLDDLRKPSPVHDVQQYILCRLDEEGTLRRQLTPDTADMLNLLHIKSGGCFLFLERVLDGVAASLVGLREIDPRHPRDSERTLPVALSTTFPSRAFHLRQASSQRPSGRSQAAQSAADIDRGLDSRHFTEPRGFPKQTPDFSSSAYRRSWGNQTAFPCQFRGVASRR